MRRTIRALVLSAATLAASACFATRNDVRTLQGDIAVLRAENARADSVHRAEFQRAAIALSAVADSVRAVNAFLARFSTDVSRFQGDLSITLHTFGQQLLTIQELIGQNQKHMQDVRAEMERQQADLANSARPSSPSGGSSSASAAAPNPNTPTGPAQLYQMGSALLTRGSYPAARNAFSSLLDQYPNDDLAGEAEFQIGHSLDLEGQAAAADSVYAIVVDKYPKTEHASSALYKRAMAAKQSGQAAKATAMFQQLVSKYPHSPEAATVADQLKKP